MILFPIDSCLKAGTADKSKWQSRPHNNELLVKVNDSTDQEIGPHGKQLLSPQSIYYTYGLADGMARNDYESLYHRPAANTGHRL